MDDLRTVIIIEGCKSSLFICITVSKDVIIQSLHSVGMPSCWFYLEQSHVGILHERQGVNDYQKILR